MSAAGDRVLPSRACGRPRAAASRSSRTSRCGRAPARSSGSSASRAAARRRPRSPCSATRGRACAIAAGDGRRSPARPVAARRRAARAAAARAARLLRAAGSRRPRSTRRCGSATRSADMLRRARGRRATPTTRRRGARGASSCPPTPAFARRFPHQLSGGQQQRVTIAIGARLRAAARRARRADDRPRRRHAGAHPRARSPACGASAAWRWSTSRTTSRSSRRSPTASPSCTPAGSSRRGRPRQCSRGRATRTRAAWSPRSPTTPRRGGCAGIPGVAVGVGERPPGCAFAPRCPQTVERCDAEMPPLEEVGPRHARPLLRVAARRRALVHRARRSSARGAADAARRCSRSRRSAPSTAGRRRARRGGRRRLASRSRAASASRSSASRAAARRRSRAASPACTRRRPGASCSTATPLGAAGAGRATGGAAAHPDRLPEPVRLAQPAAPRRATRSRGPRRVLRGLGAAEARGRGRRAARARAAAGAARRPLPGRALRRRAPARRDRARARREARRCSSATRSPRRSTSPCRRRCSSCSRSCARELGLALLFITHDLGVVASDRRPRARARARHRPRGGAGRRRCSPARARVHPAAVEAAPRLPQPSTSRAREAPHVIALDQPLRAHRARSGSSGSGVDHAEGLADRRRSERRLVPAARRGRSTAGGSKGSRRSIATAPGGARTLGFALDGDGNAFCADRSPRPASSGSRPDGARRPRFAQARRDRPAAAPEPSGFPPLGRRSSTRTRAPGVQDDGCIFAVSPDGEHHASPTRPRRASPTGWLLGAGRDARSSSSSPRSAGLSRPSRSAPTAPSRGRRVLVELAGTVPDGRRLRRARAAAHLLLGARRRSSLLEADGQLRAARPRPAPLRLARTDQHRLRPRHAHGSSPPNYGERFLSVLELEAPGAPSSASAASHGAVNVVVVTGAALGIGRATAERCLADGWPRRRGRRGRGGARTEPRAELGDRFAAVDRRRGRARDARAGGGRGRGPGATGWVNNAGIEIGAARRGR